ncbi:PREDICTED: probable aminopyrimidine aminohydrolase, mitochondrial isoform X2 [Ipomoea nil]|uniref:probable aminopyrimidine aminohydrolase, mitochondrial isoform X2 n=1 Tax=Ipomoea nil TaxID=35883 RepID=UPI000901ADFA|nr:PREDICTED: probable aminopyrimidine aminohydrolase, mitochondrial isoform X2 [Ipomoea nil]
MESANPKPAVAGNPKLLSIEVAEGVGIARRCWIKFNKEATSALYTPFVICLASGNLNIQSFRHYIAQDVHFLKAFAQAFELAEECADDDDAKIGIGELRKDVLEELKMHDSFVQEWGLEMVKESTINPATSKYTDFLLATASGKVEGVKAPGKLATPFEKTKLAAYTLGAMTPCMRLYAYIGKELQGLLDGKSNHPYKKWIENYSSEGFQASALQTEDLLDKLSVALTGEELAIIEKLYYQAMKLEIDFFLAQPLSQKTVIPLIRYHDPAEHCLMLFSDFDLTFSVVDSSAILAEIAIMKASKSNQIQSENKSTSMAAAADLRNTWGVLSKHYIEEYDQCIENMLVTEKAEKFDYEGLQKALEQLSDLEKRENLRVIECGVLKGLDLEDIKRAGERLILQDGSTSFFQSIITNEKLDADIHVLSYCWCADLIRSAFSSRGLDALKVHANEFRYEESLSTGEIITKVESPIDKLQVFNKILDSRGNGKKKRTVYIGDSVGDVLCLLEADVGILIGSSPSLKRLGDHFGLTFTPLFPAVVEKQKKWMEEEEDSSTWKGLSGVLYTVSSWAEIHAFILGS